MDSKSKENKIVLYQTDEGKVKVDVFFAEENFWMSQKTMGELFDVDRSVVTKHVKNIFTEGELDENSVCAKFAHTADDGKTYNTSYYNLDVIIAVGYRVNSIKATKFRIWATQTLKEYILKVKSNIHTDAKQNSGTTYNSILKILIII
ncbi:MAG: RhuM family protein, partial [Bacteroidaceae bacterium]|nr:RhuM family protein [Bacteroidaceae bacterium]